MEQALGNIAEQDPNSMKQNVMKEISGGGGGQVTTEGSRSAYETIRELLDAQQINIALSSGLRQVTHKGRTAWVLDNNETEQMFRDAL